MSSVEIIPLKPAGGIRFAAGDPTGLRSTTFRVWGNKKGDIYLAARPIGDAVKASLHRDGRCHVGFSEPYAMKHGIEQRHMERWRVPLDVSATPIQVAIPVADLRPFTADDKQPMYWIAPPSDGGDLILAAIVTVPPSVPMSEPWPGATIGLQPIGVIETSLRRAFVVKWSLAMNAGQQVTIDALRSSALEAARRYGAKREAGGRTMVPWEMEMGGKIRQTIVDFANT
jgi:hypothetical protein